MRRRRPVCVRQVLEINVLFLVLCPMAGQIRKAELLVRLLAKAIDLIVVLAAAKMLPQAGVLAGLLYLLVSDGLFDGRSIGKKMLNLHVQSSAGKGCSVRDSVLRNAPIAFACMLFQIPLFGWVIAPVVFGIELLLMVGNAEGKRLGDSFAGTWVVAGCAGCIAPGKSDI